MEINVLEDFGTFKLKKGENGKYLDAVYCPNCDKVMVKEEYGNQIFMSGHENPITEDEIKNVYFTYKCSCTNCDYIINKDEILDKIKKAISNG